MTFIRTKNRIICIACDLTEVSKKAIEWTKLNILEPNDTIILIHVRERFQSFDLELVDRYKSIGDEIENVLKKFKMYLVGNTVEIKILYGDVRVEILEYVQEISATLLVVGARQMSTKKYLLGSKSEYLATHSKIPIMVIR